MKRKKLIYRGTKKAIRSYIHVRDAAKASADILQSRFIKRIVLIKGKQSLKIKVLLSELKKITGLKSKLIFLNRTQKGHYDKKPKPFIKFKTLNYYRNTNLNYRQGLKELINIVKSNKF